MNRFKRLFSGEQKDPSNPRLVEAMRRVGQADGPEARRTLYHELLTCTLMVPTAGAKPEPTEPGRWTTLSEDMHADIVSIRDGEGEVAFLAFTDTDALRAWQPEGSACLGLPGRALFALALEHGLDGIWLNPAGPFAGKVTRRELEMLVKGPDEVTRALKWMEVDAALQRGGKLHVRAPAVLPSEELVGFVRRSLRPHREVSEVYIFESVLGHARAHLTIGVRFGESATKERIEEIARDAVKGAEPLISPDEIIDLIVLDRDDLLEGVRNTVGPIIRR